MHKFGVLILILLCSPILAGIYGILHDQLSYSISPEYFTKFKFIQFQIASALPYRLGVIGIGWYATWWTGIFIGLGLGLTGLIHKDSKTMLKVVIKSLLITLLITVIFGLIGLAYGKFYLSNISVNWWFPENLIDKKSFIIVGSMHNFSYLGGCIGLILGVIYQIRNKKLTKENDIFKFDKNKVVNDLK